MASLFALALLVPVVLAGDCPYSIVKRSQEELSATCKGFDCLNDYVTKDDGMFSWTDTGFRLNGTNGALDPSKRVNWTGYVLNVTSQKWLTPEDFDFSDVGGKPVGHIWWHILVVVVPSNLRSAARGGDHGFLWITGGGNGDSIPKATDQDLVVTSTVAMNTGNIGAALLQIPNARIVFSSDPSRKQRGEDAIIAWTWSQFVSDPTRTEWPLRLPMTKGAVKALDTLEQFTARLAQTDARVTPLRTFGVAGASKRGWTTWTVGAVDKRVFAIAPVVMDELNFIPNIHHHYRSYGGWSFALKDYTDLNFTECLDHPNTRLLMDIEDPYSYIQRFTMPKLVINGALDEFFLPDDTRWWWKDLPAPKHFLMVPNAEHSEVTGILEILPAVSAFFGSLISKQPVPELNWTISPTNGDITVTIPPPPPGVTLQSVDMWYSQTCNSERRDFRIINLGWGPNLKCDQCGFPVQGLCTNLAVLWFPARLKETSLGSNTYVAHRDVPAGGKWAAFFVDVVFNITRPQHELSATWPILPAGQFEFTSEVSVVPFTFPFQDCINRTCGGRLV